MANLFGKRKDKAGGAEEEAIPDDLLASIPDIDAAEADGKADSKEDRAKRARAVVVQQDAPRVDQDVRGLLLGVRNAMDSVFAKEIERVEESFAGVLRQMQDRLRAADEQLMRLQEDRDNLARANETYERKFEALKALAEKP